MISADQAKILAKSALLEQQQARIAAVLDRMSDIIHIFASRGLFEATNHTVEVNDLRHDDVSAVIDSLTDNGFEVKYSCDDCFHRFNISWN